MCALGQKTLITNYPQYYKLANYFARMSVPNLGLMLGIYNFQQVFTDTEYSNTEGGILSALGQLFRDNVNTTFIHGLIKWIVLMPQNLIN